MASSCVRCLELVPGLLQREREPLNLGMTHGLVAAGRGGQLMAAQVRQDGRAVASPRGRIRVSGRSGPPAWSC
jgi:hypothetical protein